MAVWKRIAEQSLIFIEIRTSLKTPLNVPPGIFQKHRLSHKFKNN